MIEIPEGMDPKLLSDVMIAIIGVIFVLIRLSGGNGDKEQN